MIDVGKVVRGVRVLRALNSLEGARFIERDDTVTKSKSLDKTNVGDETIQES